MDLRSTWSAWTLLVALAASGCSSALVRAAESSKLEQFRASLDEALKRGVGSGEARDVALTRARYEIATATGEDGATALAEMQSCAPMLRGALMDRARASDETAARAALMAIEAGLVAPLTHAHHVTSDQPHWRAVGARTLGVAEPSNAHRCHGCSGCSTKGCSGGGHDDVGWARGKRASDPRARAGWWRRHLMVDPYVEVRRAALRAASDARDPRDAGAVLDAARRDPDPEARALAIAAAGRIATIDTVMALADRWAAASEEERAAIVAAWSASLRASRSGGDPLTCNGPAEPIGCVAMRQLWHVAESDAGLPSLLAALDLLHAIADEHAIADASATAAGIAIGVIERAIDNAPTRIRVEAIDSAPLQHARILEAVIDASRAEDPPVAVAALARMIESGTGLSADERNKALAELRERARGTGPSAERAARELAEAGDASVLDRLARDAKANAASDRVRAAEGFVGLGKLDRALALTADVDSRVRSHAACAILRAGEK
jgi:hypothetical protein